MQSSWYFFIHKKTLYWIEEFIYNKIHKDMQFNKLAQNMHCEMLYEDRFLKCVFWNQ